jgi:hypothetical protein
MKCLGLLLSLWAAPLAYAQSGSVDSGPDLASILNFETEHPDAMPRGWSGGPPETISVDRQNPHTGRWSVRLARDAKSAENISSLTKAIPIDFAGDRIELRGFLRLEDVSGFAGFWLRQDGDGPGLAFDNMQQRQLKGTHPWAEYSIVLPLHPEANDLVFGVLVSGTGKVWADDLQLFVDGKPIR